MIWFRQVWFEAQSFLDWPILNHCSNYGLLYYLFSICIVTSESPSPERRSGVIPVTETHKVWNLMKTQARYGLIQNFPLEVLISFALESENNTFILNWNKKCKTRMNTQGAELRTHTKGRFDINSRYEIFRKLTGKLFVRFPVMSVWQSSFRVNLPVVMKLIPPGYTFYFIEKERVVLRGVTEESCNKVSKT